MGGINGFVSTNNDFIKKMWIRKFILKGFNGIY